MNKTVVIHQPDFSPYLGFFQRFLRADLYIALDHVQFVQHTKNSWTSRDKIKTENGEAWLSLGIQKNKFKTPINKIELDASITWVRRNLNLIDQNYRKSAYFEEIIPHVEGLYSEVPRLMVDFNLRSISILASLLDVNIPTILSSSLSPQGAKNEMLIDLLRKVDATHYLSGTGARVYMAQDLFEDAGIKVIWQEFVHPTYSQQYKEFIPNLSALDLLFNCGIDNSRKILRA